MESSQINIAIFRWDVVALINDTDHVIPFGLTL